MIIEYIQNPEWLNPEHTALNCEVKYEGSSEIIKITVSDNEIIQKRKDIWDQASQMGVAEYTPEVVDLNGVKTQAANFIDNYAGITRHRFITVAAGQEMTYQEKSEQAADFVAASYPVDTSNYPFIQAEMDATGKTKEQAADDILTQRSAWIAVGAVIEKHRLSGKQQVNAAANATDIKEIVDDTIALLDVVGT